MKPAPIEALKAFKVFVKLSQVVTSCQHLPQVANSVDTVDTVDTVEH